MSGQVDRARRLFEQVTGYASDLGLLTEEVYPQRDELPGNYPHGLSHIGLANAARAIHEAEERVAGITADGREYARRLPARPLREHGGRRLSENHNDIGMIGLGVMGRNLVLNLADHGLAVAVYNRSDAVTREFASHLGPGQRVQACYSLGEFLGSLKKPRTAMMMIKAGEPIDALIAELDALLEPGDIVIDGGNSHFSDTERRARSLEVKGIHFLGVGVSGGEVGARTGPSLMAGGSKAAYESVRAIFEAIAARADKAPCVAYLGPGAAGHYVKMVHNGIEYGLMQLIAETYALMKLVLRLSNEDLAAVYAEWDRTELRSYLVEITSAIFRRRDEKTGRYLVDLIRGDAGQLGTGKWASQSAMDLEVPTPNVDLAVAMRNMSALEDQRRQATTRPQTAERHGEAAEGALSRDAGSTKPHPLTVDDIRNAMYGVMVITYAQGFAHLQTASKVLGFELRLEDVASIWRGGCIIRSALLSEIMAAYRRRPALPNLLLDPGLSQTVLSRRSDLGRVVEAGVSAAVAVPGLAAALAYLDAYTADWLPFNLIQAQRDYFGAHTYRRIDEEGIFHTDWLSEQETT